MSSAEPFPYLPEPVPGTLVVIGALLLALAALLAYGAHRRTRRMLQETHTRLDVLAGAIGAHGDPEAPTHHHRRHDDPQDPLVVTGPEDILDRLAVTKPHPGDRPSTGMGGRIAGPNREPRGGYPSSPDSPRPPKPPTSTGPGQPPAGDRGGIRTPETPSRQQTPPLPPRPPVRPTPPPAKDPAGPHDHPQPPVHGSWDKRHPH